MKHVPSIVAAFILTAAASDAAAQSAPQSASSPVPAAPRIEVGAGGGWYVDPDSGGAIALIDTRGSVRLTRNWAIEGDLAFRPTDSGTGGVYRIQARWRLPVGRSSGLDPHVTFGTAGFVSRWSYPAYDYTRYDNGETVHVTARSGWNIDPPWYPTVGIGLQKRLGDHLALRADLAVGFGVSDYGVEYVFMPTVGLTIPIGHSTAARSTR